MKKKIILAVLAMILTALAVPPLIFFTRSPLLIVTDEPFAAMYGEDRLKRQQRQASRALFRRVLPVVVADGAGPDILVVAISETASRPFCVLFPRHHAPAAQRYSDEFPEIPSVLFGGLVQSPLLPAPDGLLHIFFTDRDTDMYRAGLFAGILADFGHDSQAEDPPSQRTIALWQDNFVNSEQQELFTRGAREQNPDIAVVFATSLYNMPETSRLSSAVLTGAGAQFFSNNPPVPMVLFTWLDPAMTSREVMVHFDDSPWGLAVPAAQMVKKGENEGNIPSNPLIISVKVADNGILRLLRNAAVKTP